MSSNGPVQDLDKKNLDKKKKRKHAHDSDSDSDAKHSLKKHKKKKQKQKQNKSKTKQKQENPDDNGMINDNTTRNNTTLVSEMLQDRAQDRDQDYAQSKIAVIDKIELIEKTPPLPPSPKELKRDGIVLSKAIDDDLDDIPPLPTLVNVADDASSRSQNMFEMQLGLQARDESETEIKSSTNGPTLVTMAPKIILEGPSIAILLWRHFRNAPDKTLFIEPVIMDRITWPSLANALYSTEHSHFEIETRMGILKTPKGRRFRLPSPGPHVIEHAYVAKHKLSFAPNISARAYDALKRELHVFMNSTKYTIGILSDDAIETKYERHHQEVRDYGEDIRRIDNVDTKQYHWQQKKHTSPNVEVSMRTAGSPSTDIRFSTCSEKVLADSDVGLSIDELETRWNSKRDKYLDRFIFGHFAIDMAICTIHERIRSPTGEYLGEQLEPELLRTVEVELLYKPEQLDRVLQRRKAIITQQLHISRALAAYLVHADSVMAMIM